METWTISFAISFAAGFVLWLIDGLTSAKFPAQRRLVVASSAGFFVLVALILVSLLFVEPGINIHPRVIGIASVEATSYQVAGTFTGKRGLNIYLLARKHSGAVGSDKWPDVWTVISLVEDIEENQRIWKGRMNLKLIDERVVVDDLYDIIAVLSNRWLPLSTRIGYHELRAEGFIVSNMISIRII